LEAGHNIPRDNAADARERRALTHKSCGACAQTNL
jgi:hypothetical protein